MALTEAVERFQEGVFLPPWVRNEHLARYVFASDYVAGKIVVDSACGDGSGSALYVQAGAIRVHALDLSRAAVLRAARTFRAERLRFILGDATALPLPDRSAEVYVSFETIEHIRDDDAYLREVVRVLRGSGTFLCSTPNRAVTNPGKSLTDQPWNRFHVREYDLGEFRAILDQYFGEVTLFGQNLRSRRSVTRLTRLATVLPTNGIVRLRQLLKLPRLLYDRVSHHRVKPLLDEACEPEYVVAVCRRVKTAARSGDIESGTSGGTGESRKAPPRTPHAG